mgnify:CR=1 FL=1
MTIKMEICLQRVASLTTEPNGRRSFTSDFRIQDIMDNASPVSIYLVLNPTNIQRLKPLVRLFISQLVFILMPKMEFSGGQIKASYKHQLLLSWSRKVFYFKAEREFLQRRA